MLCCPNFHPTQFARRIANDWALGTNWSIFNNLNRFLTIEDLGNLPPPRWLINGLFEQESLVMLVGPPGSFKSFLAIDWALSLAVGRPWNGRATEPSKVLYALGEGKANLLKRLQAWILHNRLTNEEFNLLNANFRITFDVPQLAVPKDTQRFINDLEEDQLSPNLFIIDTLARSFVGKNENDQLDSGVWVDSADRLRHMGMAVLVLHHTRKNTEFGLRERGSGAFLGALDTSFILERNPEGFKGYAKLYCNKQKDHAEPEDVWMQHQQIRPREDVEGSIVLVECKAPDEEQLEQKRADEEALNELIDNVLEDSTLGSQRAKARELAKQANILEATAYTKLHRRAKTRGSSAK